MSDCSTIARSAMARTQASLIASLIVVAPTSSAPRKMNGKQRTLFTWFGKSERPVAMTASGRAALATSGMISGSGLASARIRGLGAIVFSSSGLSTRVGVLRVARLVVVHFLLAPRVDDAGDIGHPDVLALDAEAHQQIEARERR